MAPTSAPRITRGSLICQTIAVSMAGTDRAGCHGSRTSRASATVAGDRPAGPTDTPTASATSSAASAMASGRPGRTRPRVVGGGPGAIPGGSGPAGPAGTGGHGRRVLMAAHGVGQDDVVRVGLDDVLGGQLRVAAGRRGAGRGVRDALHAEQGEQGTDERRGRDRVVRLVELVVVAERLGAARHRGDDLADLAAQRRVLMLSLGEMASGLAELVELGINAAQAGRRG